MGGDRDANLPRLHQRFIANDLVDIAVGQIALFQSGEDQIFAKSGSIWNRARCGRRMTERGFAVTSRSRSGVIRDLLRRRTRNPWGKSQGPLGRVRPSRRIARHTQRACYWIDDVQFHLRPRVQLSHFIVETIAHKF